MSGRKRKRTTIKADTEADLLKGKDCEIAAENEVRKAAPKKRKKKDGQRRGYNKACFLCRRDHKACDGGRPCENCTNAHKQTECVDAPPYLYKMKKPKSTKFFVFNESTFSTTPSPTPAVSSAPPSAPYQFNKTAPSRTTTQPAPRPVRVQETTIYYRQEENPSPPHGSESPTSTSSATSPASSLPSSPFSSLDYILNAPPPPSLPPELMSKIDVLAEAVKELREERGLLFSQLASLQKQQQELLTVLKDEDPSSTGATASIAATIQRESENEKGEEEEQELEAQRRKGNRQLVLARRREMSRISSLCNPASFVPFPVLTVSQPFVVVTFTTNLSAPLAERFRARYALANEEFCRLFHFSLDELMRVDPNNFALSPYDDVHNSHLKLWFAPYFNSGRKEMASPILYSNGMYVNKYGAGFRAYIATQLFLNDGIPSFMVCCFTNTSSPATATITTNERPALEWGDHSGMDQGEEEEEDAFGRIPAPQPRHQGLHPWSTPIPHLQSLLELPPQQSQHQQDQRLDEQSPFSPADLSASSPPLSSMDIPYSPSSFFVLDLATTGGGLSPGRPHSGSMPPSPGSWTPSDSPFFGSDL